MGDKPEIIADFVAVCEIAKVEWCFTLGSALGLYRDGNFIDGDNDVDVMVFADVKQLKIIKGELEARGYNYAAMIFNPGNEMNMHFKKYNNILDIHFECMKEEEKFFKTFDKVTWQGQSYNVPHPIEDYLTLEYCKIPGKGRTDWRKKCGERSRPIDNWRGITPCKSMKINCEEYFNFMENPKGKFLWANVIDKDWNNRKP